MGDDNETGHHPAEHYDRVHEAWRLIMGEEFHYGYFEYLDAPLDSATAALTRLMRERAKVGSGQRVLDIGCGTGRQACDLAQEAGASVLGISTSSRGVAAARALAAERGLGQAKFEERDGSQTGLDSRSFDAVWALESSHLMRDRAALLAECLRLLVPGGRLVLCDITRQREIPFLEVRSRRQDFATLRRAFGDAHMEPLDAYVAWLEDLGATVEDALDISSPTRPTLGAWRANVEAHHPALSELLGPEGVDDFLSSTRILESFWDDGTLGYGILTAVKRA